jgi:hypothetical protein
MIAFNFSLLASLDVTIGVLAFRELSNAVHANRIELFPDLIHAL